jgi:hypothetical protein
MIFMSRRFEACNSPSSIATRSKSANNCSDFCRVYGYPAERIASSA